MTNNRFVLGLQTWTNYLKQNGRTIWVERNYAGIYNL